VAPIASRLIKLADIYTDEGIDLYGSDDEEKETAEPISRTEASAESDSAVEAEIDVPDELDRVLRIADVCEAYTCTGLELRPLAQPSLFPLLSVEAIKAVHAHLLSSLVSNRERPCHPALSLPAGANNPLAPSPSGGGRRKVGPCRGCDAQCT
jgi:hypothetical protein